MITALPTHFDVNRILNEINKIILWSPNFHTMRWDAVHQISLRWSSEWDSKDLEPAYWFSGTGSLYNEYTKTFITTTDTFGGRYKELTGSYIEEVIEEVTEIARSMGAGIGRIRILRLRPKTCYTLHVDPEEFRLHIPLISNQKCFFVAGDQIDRMSDIGRLYQFRTKLMHTAVNASTENRLHLVFDTYALK